MHIKDTRRYRQLARSVEKRLRKLPQLLKQEFRASMDRQLHAMRRIERSVEIIAMEVSRQREALEKDADG